MALKRCQNQSHYLTASPWSVIKGHSDNELPGYFTLEGPWQQKLYKAEIWLKYSEQHEDFSFKGIRFCLWVGLKKCLWKVCFFVPDSICRFPAFMMDSKGELKQNTCQNVFKCPWKLWLCSKKSLKLWMIYCEI